MRRLLGASDPAPVFAFENDTKTPLMVLCDHASNAVPQALNTLGLGSEDMARHIAWDIGARVVAEKIVRNVGGFGIFGGYSRLVIDCNRPLWNKTLVPEISDRTQIPGNVGLSWPDIAHRVEEIYLPYHLAIADAHGRFVARELQPFVLFVHSFTPRMSGVSRPWSIGIPHSSDDSISRPFSALMQRMGSFEVGDDEPYGFDSDYSEDYSIVEHAISKGLRHLFIEIRQDEISDEAGATIWSGRIQAALKELNLF